MANDLNVDGRLKVGTFKKNFMEKFGVGVRVYTGKKFASDDVTLSSIRAEGAKGGKVNIHGRTKVGNVEKMFKEQLGIKIQIQNKAGDLADNSLSLAQAGK